jgi:hypothetical protein
VKDQPVRVSIATAMLLLGILAAWGWALIEIAVRVGG